ncbi:major facilitator superfamily domain-containing protein [Lipomyces kononenkoae]|uniref:Major facilitator superfamily domain-containing protein n=1 Tax=Lipomyces kononenkoae TaxID=34357 RepID=A0ACC3T1L3_LIPKO
MNSEDGKSDIEKPRPERPVAVDPSNEAIHEDLFNVSDGDAVLAKKMALLNAALDDIGMTWYHWKLFCLNGFGYAVDSLLIVCQTVAQPQVELQYPRADRIRGISVASSVGLFVGAVFWGMGADIIGRRVAFNTSLFVCAIFVVIAGAMPSYLSFAAMVAIYSAGSGGNYVLDATTLHEFLPRKMAFLTTVMAVWWGVGYTVTGLFAWVYMSKFSCARADTCEYANNKGWRYLHYTAGSLVIVCALLRLAVTKMEHTPKWLLTQGRDREVILVLNKIASSNERVHSLTLEQLEGLGVVQDDYKRAKHIPRRTFQHIVGLFKTKKLAYSTTLLFFLWILIGIANPLYAVFRPYYLKTRGYMPGETASIYITWRNYAIANICGLVGPFLTWPLLNSRYVGRRGTLAIGALLTMIFLFAYTQVVTADQNFAISCVISAVENMLFGSLYGITPELLPTASRGTGYGLAVAINRICNVIASLIGSYANVETTAPLFVCASFYGGMVIVSMMLPFESDTHTPVGYIAGGGSDSHQRNEPVT